VIEFLAAPVARDARHSIGRFGRSRGHRRELTIYDVDDWTPPATRDARPAGTCRGHPDCFSAAFCVLLLQTNVFIRC